MNEDGLGWATYYAICGPTSSLCLLRETDTHHELAFYTQSHICTYTVGI
jgi:hypothetical protein